MKVQGLSKNNFTSPTEKFKVFIHVGEKNMNCLVSARDGIRK